MFIRTQTNGSRTYLLLVENERVNGRLVQRVLHRFGRLDELRASGQLDTLVQSLGRFAEKIVVLDADAKGETTPTQTATIGPGLIFDRLWRECGIQAVLQAELATRRFDSGVERAIFLTVVHRLMAPGSDRAAERWKQDYALRTGSRTGCSRADATSSTSSCSSSSSTRRRSTSKAPAERRLGSTAIPRITGRTCGK